MVVSTTYRAFCVNEDCGHFMNKSWAFKPSFVEDEVCPKCQSKFELREVVDENGAVTSGIINNRGELHNKVGSEWSDFLRRIKKGSKNSTMKDY